jgi:hypothetical protein
MIYFCRHYQTGIGAGKGIHCCLKKKCWALKIFFNNNEFKKYIKRWGKKPRDQKNYVKIFQGGEQKLLSGLGHGNTRVPRNDRSTNAIEPTLYYQKDDWIHGKSKGKTKWSTVVEKL